MLSKAVMGYFVAAILLIAIEWPSKIQITEALSPLPAKQQFNLLYGTFGKGRQFDSYRHNNTDINNYIEEVSVANFLSSVNSFLRFFKHNLAEATWNLQINGSAKNRKKLVQVKQQFNRWYADRSEDALQYRTAIGLPDAMARQLKFFTKSDLAKSDTLARIQTDLQNSMEAHYNTQVEKLSNTTSEDDTKISLLSVMATSREPARLEKAWTNWRQAIGPPMKPLYQEYVTYLNLAASENGFPDYSVYWKQSLFPDTPHLDGMLETLWDQVRPLYLQLHAHVRRKLTLKYGTGVVGTDGTIPAHLLGDMWAQHWTHINDVVAPYPEAHDMSSYDAEMKRRFNAIDLFRLAENFYTSLGFPRMTQQFWLKSHLGKRRGDRDGSSLCEASAYDLYNAGDYRIKMCATVSLSDLKTAHHEMGHIQYFMAYSELPTVYRAPPNAAFHESVGDIAQLSLLSDRRLRALGLAKYSVETKRCSSHRKRKKKVADLNKLMQVALYKLAFLPFGLLLDKWRWLVFQGQISPENYNRMWWELRLHYQGVTSPVPRSESDFDPAAKYHIPAHMPFVSYFVAYIQEFQMFKALCDLSGHHGLLHDCDLYGSKVAGRKLRGILSSGSSKPWQELFQSLTGSDTVTTNAIFEYFRPLQIWLERYNSYDSQAVGWNGAVVNWGT